MPTITKMTCPICKLEANDVRVSDYGERMSIECGRCGKFKITRTAARIAETTEIRPKLSAWIRERSETGANVPEVNSNTLKEIEAALPNYRVAEKQSLLMQALERRTRFPGDEVDVITHLDFPLAWATSELEFRYLLRLLVERDLIRRIGGLPGNTELTDNFQLKFQITANGWNFLDQHARPAIISEQVFVAMSFAPELTPAWENGIKVAVMKAGFRPYRVDAQPHIDRIDTKIMAEIKSSRFVVADVTLQRQGVYFEAGYAAGLGLPVFWTVRKDDLPNVHFDTRQYNHIVWESEEQLGEQLYSFVIALIGKGSAK